MIRCAAAVAVFALVAGSAVAQELPPVAPTAAAPLPFDDWLLALRSEAAGRGIRPEILERALTGVLPVEQILERDRSQAEFTLNLDVYLRRRLTRDTVRTAQKMYSEHRVLLQRVTKAFGVNPRVVIAVWGLESNFGRFSGVRPTIPALITLAYDPRRGEMFRKELFSALEILNRGDIELESLKGSWAGALGQPQFMPSSYLQYAVDFDADGRRDIWSSLPDVFASVGFYLQQHGWKDGQMWGREVRIPAAARARAAAVPRRETGCRAERMMTAPAPLRTWRRMGLRTVGGAALPSSTVSASLMQSGNRSFLLYENYDALLGYNCAHTYALSVALLAERLK